MEVRNERDKDNIISQANGRFAGGKDSGLCGEEVRRKTSEQQEDNPGQQALRSSE